MRRDRRVVIWIFIRIAGFQEEWYRVREGDGKVDDDLILSVRMKRFVECAWDGCVFIKTMRAAETKNKKKDRCEYDQHNPDYSAHEGISIFGCHIVPHFAHFHLTQYDFPKYTNAD